VMPGFARDAAFVLILVGFGAKAASYPSISGCPAPTGRSGQCDGPYVGIMSKTAVYGILRFLFSYLACGKRGGRRHPGHRDSLRGARRGIRLRGEKHKKLLAYSSIENMGIIFIGLASPS
jgi:formate hydrogenlyase subunit 3/multisubunit Na+/H+ antiporter MnhD subunit